MFKDKINSRWIVNDEKHEIKKIMEWAEKKQLDFSTSYIMQTFCRQDGTPYTRGSINTCRSSNGFTGSSA